MNPALWSALGGMATTGGLLIAARGLVREPPALSAVVDRWQPTADPTRRRDLPRTGVLAASLEALSQRLPSQLRVTRRELELAGKTTHWWVMTKLAGALVGLAFPAWITAILSLGDLTPPLVIPVAVGVILALVGFVAPDDQVRRGAKAAEVEFRNVTSAFLDLVALSRLANAGISEAVTAVAAIGDGPAFERIRGAVERASAEGQQAWLGIKRLAAELELPDLNDVADILQTAALESASVSNTLMARARSLRERVLADQLALANERSEAMRLPAILLGISLLMLAAYPLLIRFTEI
jgi:hypothetical protein